MESSTPGFDVVAVPDFSTPSRMAVFEARVLFFLASWLEYAGKARAFPLRLACIGEPPASVRRMAQECGATVDVCRPFGLAGKLTANKLRGLEMPSTTGRVLMLDADLFVLGDLSALAEEIPEGIAAAPAGSKWVPEALWQQIYAHLKIPIPEERMPLLRMEYGFIPAAQATRKEYGQTTDLRRMLPYYNSGVFLTPHDAGLRKIWADHLARVTKLFPEDRSIDYDADSRSGHSLWDILSRVGRKLWGNLSGQRIKYPRSLTSSDQATFSTAVQALRGRGVPFTRLPDAYHARRLHFQAGRLRFGEIKIYHATGFLRLGRRERWDLGRALDQGVHQWQQGIRAGGCLRDQAEADNDAIKAGEFLNRLYRDHVRPALAERGAA